MPDRQGADHLPAREPVPARSNRARRPRGRLTTDLPEHVFAAELGTIEARRAAAGIPTESLSSVPDGKPSVARGLFGLAISGGGIRSSTLSLGVIQALARAGVFERFDYLSTVSGGGYTGSMLSSLLRDEGATAAGFPLEKPEGKEEPPALRHLRNGSNYLNPGGFLDTLRLPAVVLRGLLLNLVLVLPYLIFLVWLTEYVHENSHRLELFAPRISEAFIWLRDDVSALLAIIPLLIGFYLLFAFLSEGEWKWRDRYERMLAAGLIGGGGGLILAVPIWSLTGWAIQYPLYGPTGLGGFVADHLSASTWIAALSAFLGAYALVKASENLSKVVSKAMLYGAAVAGPGLLFGLFLLLLIAQVDSPIMTAGYRDFDNPLAADSIVTDTLGPRTNDSLGEERADTVAAWMHLVVSDSLRRKLAGKGIVYDTDRYDLAAEIPAILCTRARDGERVWHLAQITVKELAVAGEGPSPTICRNTDDEMEGSTYYRFRQRGDYLVIVGAKLRLGGPRGDQTLMADDLFISLGVLLLLFNYLFLDVNKSSLHSFYRDRLSKLYLFRLGKDREVIGNDEQKLSTLNGEGSVAPYHIINTTLNLQGEAVESVRGRSSDFFFFSKHFCGGPHTDYCRTEDMEDWDPHVNLGTAMAISAAAAAPNMGATTQKSMVFILTMLNFRLGYWLPNPSRVKEGRRLVMFRSARPGTPRLLAEALGRLTSTGKMVNVSDGGHLENMAIYELLRRRCSLIVCIDGEADPQLTFHGLVTLMRIAKIDLGIDIDIDLEPLKWHEDESQPGGEVTKAHFAVGRINYGSEGEGRLVYLKSSFSGDENPYVKKYRADHPDFPHETTADQFFDEIQFEAYRALGEHMGEMLMKDPRTRVALVP